MRDTYYIIHSWMIHELKLAGAKLQVYAVIYGFSRGGQGTFSGTVAYLQDCTGVSRSSVKSALRELVSAGLVNRAELHTAAGFPVIQYSAAKLDKELPIPEKPPEPQDPEESGEVVLSIALTGGKQYHVHQSEVDKLRAYYPAVDIMQELRSAAAWCDANPTKRKTKAGMPRFLNSWMARVQNRGGTPGYAAPNKPVPKSGGDYLC